MNEVRVRYLCGTSTVRTYEHKEYVHALAFVQYLYRKVFNGTSASTSTILWLLYEKCYQSSVISHQSSAFPYGVYRFCRKYLLNVRVLYSYLWNGETHAVMKVRTVQVRVCTGIIVQSTQTRLVLTTSKKTKSMLTQVVDGLYDLLLCTQSLKYTNVLR